MRSFGAHSTMVRAPLASSGTAVRSPRVTAAGSAASVSQPGMTARSRRASGGSATG